MIRTSSTRRTAGGFLVLTALCASLSGWLPSQASPGVASSAAAAGDAFTLTKKLDRTFVKSDGTSNVISSHTVTVKADKTKNLRGRQRIEISWSGAQPSGGRASNPYGENGLAQEYPVVIMQCRGIDDPKLVAAQRLAPQTCFTASFAQRSQITRSDSEALWRQDLYATLADRERVSGLVPFPKKEKCPSADIDPFSTHLTPFVALNGTVFSACDANDMPPESAVGGAFPPNEIYAFSDANGSGHVQFEVRSDIENESLGCNAKVACSIVVVPIVGMSCAQPADSKLSAVENACRKGGRFLPGSSNSVGEGIDLAVGPELWWSASNWKNRFSIPITFGLPPDTCDILDPRAPTSFAGSELLAQAALQWAPAYCLNKKRFKFQLNQMSDNAGFNLMEGGGSAAAIVSSEHDPRGADKIGYAPTAVTGFSVGYVIDRPDNAGEYINLRLNGRLLAKLLTQSYVGSELGRGHPGMAENPVGLMNDPEFVALNPGLSDISQEAGATVLSLSIDSDVVGQVTDYIAHDKEAMAFVDGKADQWGMKVNPAYKKFALPTSEFPLLDDYVPATADTCRKANPAVYLSQIAAPVTTLRKISEALLDAWPNVQTRCEFDASTKLYKLGRKDRQGFGARFMLGIVSLGDAERYGLRSAALEVKPGTYVAPTEDSLSAAVAMSTQKDKLGPFLIDQAKVRKSTKAYPGTMIVYTAARLSNLLQEDADKVAQFIDISTSEGQQSGSGNGELPEGYLPIKKTGATSKLYDAAAAAAVAIKAQKPPKTDVPETETDTGTTPPSTDTTVPDSTPDTVPDSTKPKPPETEAPPIVTVEAATAATPDADSKVAGRVIPGLLIIGFVGLLYSVGSRFFVRPPRPLG